MKITYEIKAGGKQFTEIVRIVTFDYIDKVLCAVCELPDRSCSFNVPAHLIIEIESL